VPDELTMPLDDAIELAQQYLDTVRPFHAHEVLEALWKSRPPGERDLWQGLAQICVGITHALRGNAKGAVALLQRGSDRVAGYAGDPHGIDVGGVLDTSTKLRATLRAAHGVRPDAFRLNLR
jgi:hypothetical protein